MERSHLNMKILYFDCYAGISGDMTLGALLDLGVDPDRFREELAKLNLEGYRIEIKKSMKNGITGTDVDVILQQDHDHEHSEDHTHAHPHDHTNDHGHDHDHHHSHTISHDHHHSHDASGLQRDFKQISRLITDSGISDAAKKMALDMFERLAKAEGKIHNMPFEEVHFHEVGAVDSIVDIVGTAICIDLLKPDAVMASPVHIGGGMTRSQHGIIPVPAPATLELLKGIPIYSKGFQGELVTPTGATILATLCSEFTEYPSMVLQGIGYGMGKKNFDFPNCLRVCLGESIKK
jgi:uncharacterized protein (DUF111 family)